MVAGWRKGAIHLKQDFYNMGLEEMRNTAACPSKDEILIPE